MSPIPLSEIHQSSDRLSSNLALPSWVNGQLGLDIQRTLAIMDMGGIRSLRISPDRERQGTARPLISGINLDGSVIASSLSADVQTKDFKSIQTSDASGFNLRNSTWTDVKISISLQALEEYISNKKKPQREIGSWTPSVDKAVRSGITKESVRHLLLNHTKEQLLAGIIFNTKKTVTFLAIAGLFVKELAPAMPALLLAASSSWIIPYAILTTDGIKKYGKNAGGKGFRISLLPGYELDRAASLVLMNRRPLVVPMRNN